ncbi:MAG: uncharacterized protein A8A55_2020 [Amphiamblys sp. WSBS2006]|nr:MAG: uncharacterized protein A8A55_2020 [Amphiamblys sp. WSBS2006]
MVDLTHESFAKHGDSLFLIRNIGILIVSEASLKNKYEDVKKKEPFLYEQGQKVVEMAKQNVLNNTAGEVFHSFSLTHDLPNETILLTDQTTVTLSNIEMSEKLFFMLLKKTKVTIGERFSITEHVYSEDCIREHSKARRSPFCLERYYRPVLGLTLENIERMAPNSIGCSLERVRLYNTGLINILPKLRINEDCEFESLVVIANKKEHVAIILSQEQTLCVGSVKKMALKNYAVSILSKLRIHKDSMVEKLRLNASEKEHIDPILSQGQLFCVGRVKNMSLKNYVVSVLPKTRIHEGYEVEWLWLNTSKEEHIAEILSQDQPFCIGRAKNMLVSGYAVSVLPKLLIHKDQEIEFLKLVASKEEHVSTILAQDQKFCVGRVKKMKFEEYAVFVFLKMKETRENLESLVLSINGDELWRKMQGELKEENTVICIEEVGKLTLKGHAVNILPALKTKREMDRFVLDANTEDQISEVLAEKYKGVSFEGIKGFGLSGSTMNLLPKMRIGEDCEIETYNLFAQEERQVSHVLGKEDRSIATGRVKNMELLWYAVCVIPKLRIHEDNIMESFVLDAGKRDFSRILEEGDSSIELGRIRTGGLGSVPEEIRRKLRYTLVGGVGNEILEERGEEPAAVSDGEVGETVDREATAVVEKRNGEAAAGGNGEVGETVEGEVNEVAEKEIKKETFFLGTKQPCFFCS